MQFTDPIRFDPKVDLVSIMIIIIIIEYCDNFGDNIIMIYTYLAF